MALPILPCETTDPSKPGLSPYPLCASVQIDRNEIGRRCEFLRFDDQDEKNLGVIHDLIKGSLTSIIAEFYDHLVKFDEIRDFLSEPQRLKRLKETQSRYLFTLGQDHGQATYFENRLRIGMIHEQVKLPQKWYLGAYAMLFESLGRRLQVRCARQSKNLLSLLVTLYKIFTLDSILAVEAYYQASVHRLEETLQKLASAQESLERLSRIDELTQVNNRRSLMELLQAELGRSRRFLHPFTLLFIDVDHFKIINDRNGHAFGDYILKATVSVVREMLRPQDIIGRYGGEEFLVGLVESDKQAGREIAERIRHQVEETSVEYAGRRISLTISIGLTELTPETKDLDEMIGRADRALYRAKRNGRNRVCAEHSHV